jgi:hypothetical protein
MRKHELTINAFLFLPIIIMFGFLLVTLWPINIMIMLAFYGCGLCDLVYAKLPLYRHHIFSSFGPSHIPTGRRDAYYRGYKRVALGATLNVLILIHVIPWL